MRAQLVEVEDLTPSIKTFWFRPERTFRFMAGQFIELTIPGAPSIHQFTISSSPSEPRIGITTRISKHGSTYKQALAILQPGTTVTISEAMGDFVLPKDHTIPLVFIAGGIGITPFRSIIAWLTDMNDRRDITLLYAAAHAHDLIFTSTFDAYTTHVHYYLGGQPITSNDIVQAVPNTGSSYFYIAGPEPMVLALNKQLRNNHNVRREHIISDYFIGYDSLAG